MAFSAMVTCNLASSGTKTWIVDSGASDHITGSVELLSNIRPAGSNLTINLPTGAVSKITHVGDVKLENGLILSNVLLVPQFKHNLLSIHKLARDNNCDIQFTPQACKIVNTKSGVLEAMATVKDGLYYLQDSVNHTSFCNAAVVDCATWHLRLGHAAVSKMKSISHLQAQCNDLTSDQVCLTCPMAKFHKLPFPVSKSHASEVFALIHLDTWGPYKIPTRGKFRYFLTIVDDKSRNTWLYLMQHNLDFLHCFQAFYNYVATQFKKKIESIRSDIAPEFSDAACIQFYTSHGIVHQRSCVQTSTKCQSRAKA